MPRIRAMDITVIIAHAAPAADRCSGGIRLIVSCCYIVFGCRNAADARLLSNILAATAHELAVDAIVSIIFSPGTSKPFGALAASLKVPSCLIYGREDPWVRPCYAPSPQGNCQLMTACGCKL